jgi:hypothetical protein
VYAWYHGEYARITTIHRDFAGAIDCSFWKIMVGHRYSDISNMISNIGYSRFVPMTSMLEKQPWRRIYSFSSSLYLFTNLVTTKAEEIDTS